MGIGAKLTLLMKELGTNANEVAKKAGIPAATIYSLIRRDATKVDIDSLIKIARTLGVSADYFCNEDVSVETINNISITNNEIKLLNIYQSLNEDGKRELLKRAEELKTLGYAEKRGSRTTA